MTLSLSHTHRFIPATATGGHPLLLLHGTGGDEHDLIGLGTTLAPGAALLSPRGQVLENGMPRFFRRLREGVFDEADLLARTHALGAFITEAQEAYGLSAPIAVGFSNGANIAASLLMHMPRLLAGAVLLRPMQPFQEPPAHDLNGTPVLMLSGSFDPIVPLDNATSLAGTFTHAGAKLSHEFLPVGHALTQMDIVAAKTWLHDCVPASL